MQGFIAFNVTAHSLVSTTLSHRREGEAARIMARISQLAVGTSLVLGVVLYAGGVGGDLGVGCCCFCCCGVRADALRRT